MFNISDIHFIVSAVTLFLLIYAAIFVSSISKKAGMAFSIYLERLLEKNSFPNYNDYNMPIRRDVTDWLTELQIQYNVRLTPQAQSMLLNPIIEHYTNSGRSYFAVGEREIWQGSLDKIFQTIVENPGIGRTERVAGNNRNRYGAVAVINAFQQRWCNIPPFCVSK